jgi:hypothetical protein
MHTKKHQLEAGAALALRDARGSAVTCLSGSLWLTMESDSRDVVLKPGDEHVIDREGLTILAAAEASLVEVRAPHQASSWWARFIDLVDRSYGPAAIRPARKWVH